MNRTALSLILCAPLCAGGIPSDKGYHAAAGAVAYVAGYEVSKVCGSEHPKLWGFASALTVGLAKEAMDSRDKKHHSVEAMDAVATLGGGIVVSWVWRF